MLHITLIFLIFKLKNRSNRLKEPWNLIISKMKNVPCGRSFTIKPIGGGAGYCCAFCCDCGGDWARRGKPSGWFGAETFNGFLGGIWCCCCGGGGCDCRGYTPGPGFKGGPGGLGPFKYLIKNYVFLNFMFMVFKKAFFLPIFRFMFMIFGGCVTNVRFGSS